jgi:lysozyme
MADGRPAPVAPPPKRSSKTPPKAPAAIAAAVLVAAPLATQFEGYRGTAYRDPAHILTVCYGETEAVDPVRVYSRDECAARLRSRMAADYAPPLLKCLPPLADTRRAQVFGALLDASYNAGPAAVCKSRMAAAIKAGDWVGGCRGLVGWYVTARDRRTGERKQLPGLVKRRQAESRTCMLGAVLTPAAVQAAPPPAPPAPPAPPPRPSLLQRIAQFINHLLGVR